MSAAIHVLLGTRAQLIKMAPVIREFERRGVPLSLIFTGQHRVTMEELLADFGIATVPRHVYSGPEIKGLAQMLAWFVRVLFALVSHPARWFPRRGRGAMLLVHGDTMSTLLGALAGRLVGLRVGHVESGLRSFNLRHPFPEELTRLAVFALAHVGYCPGAWAAQNLAGRRIEAVDTGANTLLDAVRDAVRRAPPGPAGAYCVASIHRFENLSDETRLRGIVATLDTLGARARCVFVLHPVTESRLQRLRLLDALRANPRFELVPRMTYTRFVALLQGARFVVTDGGSNQEELSYLGIPTILMRAATERQEGLGQNVLLSHYDAARIMEFLDRRAPAPPSALDASASPSARVVDDVLRRCGAA